MIYQSFASIYDELMDPQLYEQWINYAENHLPPRSSILELGCGSGHLAIALSQRGYKMTGLDQSSAMLTLARQYQEDASEHFMLIEGDMTDLADFPMYDSIISFCDSICYLPSENVVKQTFQEVYNHLKPGGKFLFDVHTPSKIKEFEDYSVHFETEDAVLLWDSYEGDEELSAEHYLTIFKEQKDNSYQRFDEHHYQRTYELTTYKDMLQQVGFKDIIVTADFDQDIQLDSKRWFFEVRK